MKPVRMFALNRSQRGSFFDVGDPDRVAGASAGMTLGNQLGGDLPEAQALSRQVGGPPEQVLDHLTLFDVGSLEEKAAIGRVLGQFHPEALIQIGPPGGVEQSQVDIVPALKFQRIFDRGRRRLGSGAEHHSLEVRRLVVDHAPTEEPALPAQCRGREAAIQISPVQRGFSARRPHDLRGFRLTRHRLFSAAGCRGCHASCGRNAGCHELASNHSEILQPRCTMQHIRRNGPGFLILETRI